MGSFLTGMTWLGCAVILVLILILCLVSVVRKTRKRVDQKFALLSEGCPHLLVTTTGRHCRLSNTRCLKTRCIVVFILNKFKANGVKLI